MSGFPRGKGYATSLIYSVPRQRPRWRKAAMWLVSIGLIALIAWCSTLYYWISRFEGTPAPGTPIHADVGIVLGATLWNNEPSPGLRERLDHALSLYRSGSFKNFIVTGGLDSNGATLTEAEGMRNYLIAQGVPESNILMDSLSRSTYENLIFAQDIMDRQEWQTAVIVTHDYHGSRAADIAKTVGFNPVQVSVMKSKVLKMSYHETREILAYTKWLATKLFL
ncbi:YdcF family protein [Cohnella mopanensis]|uniref:YdcF family protein n=1 Tax=Cohnella mopanensis TaxID=2911966 RepID=UPI001EF9A9F3|nr:YdcF family protein [Cohnella mopanensis]